MFMRVFSTFAEIRSQERSQRRMAQRPGRPGSGRQRPATSDRRQTYRPARGQDGAPHPAAGCQDPSVAGRSAGRPRPAGRRAGRRPAAPRAGLVPVRSVRLWPAAAGPHARGRRRSRVAPLRGDLSSGLASPSVSRGPCRFAGRLAGETGATGEHYAGTALPSGPVAEHIPAAAMFGVDGLHAVERSTNAAVKPNVHERPADHRRYRPAKADDDPIVAVRRDNAVAHFHRVSPSFIETAGRYPTPQKSTGRRMAITRHVRGRPLRVRRPVDRREGSARN